MKRVDANRHLVFDAALLAAHFQRPCDDVESLLQSDARCWISASSVPALGAASRDKLVALLQRVDVLTSRGHEQAAMLATARNLEQAQVVLAARVLDGRAVRLVSDDAGFDTLGEIERCSPRAARDWLQAAPAADAAMPFIDVAAQQITLRPQLEERIERVLRHGQYIMGPEVRELEQQLEEYCGARHCISVASGTEALLICMMALGIGPGDEVITTPFTFAATAETIVLLGATPVWVDIEPDTCNIDARLIEAAITPRTRAIMPVSLYGQVADMDEINAIAAHHGNITVIEDAAQSFGADYRGRKSCNLSTFACTSFFPSKPLGCYGDGGAIFTSDDALAQACREIRLHGQSQRYVHTRVGVGGRMDTLQCAVVLAKMERFEHEVQRRIENGDRYGRLLDAAGVPRVALRPDRSSVHAQLTVFVDERRTVQEALKQAGIPTAVHYPIPLNRQPVYAALPAPFATPHADAAAARVMSLPMSGTLGPADIERIVRALVAASR